MPENGLRKIQAISFPRSGHHLLADCLCRYFGQDLTSVTDRKSWVLAGDFGYCEYYHHCRQWPCPQNRTTYQKNHDQDLSLPENPESYYIIQYRHPLEAIVSEYRLLTHWRYRCWLGRSTGVQKSRLGWVAFAMVRMGYWKSFVRKWVIEKRGPNKLILSYEALVQNPRQIISQAIKFIDPGAIVNSSSLSRVINSKKIKRRSRIEDFKYYESEFFDDLAKQAEQEIELLYPDQPKP